MRIEVPYQITPEMVLEIRQSWERLGLGGESQGFQIHEFLRDVGDILRGEGVAKVQPPQFERKFIFLREGRVDLFRKEFRCQGLAISRNDSKWERFYVSF